jgi:hypothetical protein
MPLELIPLATWLLPLGIAAALATTNEEPASPWGMGFFHCLVRRDGLVAGHDGPAGCALAFATSARRRDG